MGNEFGRAPISSFLEDDDNSGDVMMMKMMMPVHCSCDNNYRDRTVEQKRPHLLNLVVS